MSPSGSLATCGSSRLRDLVYLQRHTYIPAELHHSRHPLVSLWVDEMTGPSEFHGKPLPLCLGYLADSTHMGVSLDLFNYRLQNRPGWTS